MTEEQGSYNDPGGATTSTANQASTTGSVDGSSADSGPSNKLQEAAGSVAGRLSDTAQEKVGTQVDSLMRREADMLQQLAGAVRKSGEQLREEQPQIAGFADTAAQQVERAAQYLRETDMQGMVRGAEDFARRQPALFLGGALALGLVASRFLKASPQGGSNGSSGGSGQMSGYRSGYQAGSGGSTSTYGRAAYGRSGYDRAGYGSYGAGRDYAGAAVGAGNGSSNGHGLSDTGAEHGGA